MCQKYKSMLELHYALACFKAIKDSEVSLDDAKTVLRVLFSLDSSSGFCQFVKQFIGDEEVQRILEMDNTFKTLANAQRVVACAKKSIEPI